MQHLFKDKRGNPTGLSLRDPALVLDWGSLMQRRCTAEPRIIVSRGQNSREAIRYPNIPSKIYIYIYIYTYHILYNRDEYIGYFILDIEYIYIIYFILKNRYDFQFPCNRKILKLYLKIN